MNDPGSVSLAWLVHLYTASSALFAFFSVARLFDGDYRAAFFWLYVAVFVDATDGTLARRARVATRIPWFNGPKLDDIVDYLTYVFVPAIMVWHAGLVPAAWTTPVAGAMLLSSAFGFNREDAKTGDHFFTGFPSYWNVVVFYVYVAQLPSAVNALVLLTLAVMVFVPLRYVYPSRTPVLRAVTVALGAVWGVLMIVMLAQLPAVSATVFRLSLVFPAYYVMLSLVLTVRRRAAAHPAP